MMFIMISLLTLIHSVGFCSDPSDNLKALLIDLKGWETDQAEGSSINMGGMKMINVIRNYSNGEKHLDVTILVGSHAMIQGHTQPVDIQTSDVNVTVSEMDGFDVIQNFNKNESNGYIVINLEKKTTEGSLFIINYAGMSSKDALKISKKYDWNKIKTVASSMMD
jgi:hypothetical protein